MQACIKTENGKVEMLDVPTPEPGEGEIVVRMSMATVCGTDMHLLDEFPNEMIGELIPGALIPQGLPMGHEAVGVVHQVGPGVTRFQPGDRVIGPAITSCGKCKQCMHGDYGACSGGGVSRMLFGCQGEYFRVAFAEVSAAKVPEAVSDEHAVLATDIMTTGFGAIERGELRCGDSVAVFAQGPVGLCATAGARSLGAGLIIAVDALPERLEMSKRLGANVVINPKDKEPVAEILALTNNEGVDVAVEAVGTQATFEAATRAVRAGGTVSSVGVYGLLPQLSMPVIGVSSFYHRKIVTTLAPGGHDRLTHLMDLVRYGDIDLSPLFTHRMKLADCPKAYDLFRAKTDGVLKIAITP